MGITELMTKIVSQKHDDVERQLKNALQWSCDFLKLETGIISNIDTENNSYTIQEYYSEDSGLSNNQVYDLSSTYCSIAMHHNDVLAIERMNESMYSNHECYLPFKLESYLGICFEVQGSFYGTVNFSSSEPRSFDFIPEEKQLLKFLGGWVSSILYRKNIESKFKKEHQLYKLISTNSAEMICMHKPDGTYTFISDSVKDLLGYEPFELIGTSPYELFHTDDLEQIAQESHTRSLEGQNAPTVQYRIRKKDGTYIWFDTATQPVVNADGEVIHLQTTSREITEKKRLEILFQKSQEMAKIGGWEYDIINNELYWTKEVYRIHELPTSTKVTVEEAIDFYPEGEARETISAVVNTAIKEGLPWDLELPILTSKGNSKWVRALGEAEFAEGKAIKIKGTFQDISGKKREQILFNKSQEMAGVGGWEYEINTETLYWTDEVYRIHEIPIGSGINVNDLSRFYPKGEPRNRIQDAVRLCIAAGKPYDIETPFITAKGSRIWVRAIGEAEFLDGKPAKIRGTFQNITQQKLYEDQITDQIRQLTGLKDTREKLYSILAHDLRNSIYGISGLLSYVSSDVESGEFELQDVVSKLNLLTQSADQTYKLLDNMLTWVKLQSGSLQITKAPLDICSCIDASISLLQPSLDTKKIEISLSKNEHCMVFAEEKTITTVIRNLLNNAIKFSQPQSTIDISFSTDSVLGHLRVHIRDFGIGMDKKTVQNLFSPTNRNIQRGTADEKGSGLGLLLSKELMELNEGDIFVQSTPGKGSEFVITLPLS